MATHTVASEKDWNKLKANGLDTVIDPMVIRSGELFLRGSAGVADPDRVWNVLSRNVHSVGMFFDALILQQRIPVFNYGATFDAHVNLDAWTLHAVNRDESVLEDVDVMYGPYMDVKRELLAELAERYSGDPINSEMAQDIAEELAAAEYQWQPHLGELEAQLPSEVERIVARFLLGGLIFGAYAQILEGEHVIQPKRSRVFLAVALGARSAQFRFEEELFDELKKRARASVTELPSRPSFFLTC
jgi:hypothetical protein